jgi:hypothetical protein
MASGHARHAYLKVDAATVRMLQRGGAKATARPIRLLEHQVSLAEPKIGKRFFRSFRHHPKAENGPIDRDGRGEVRYVDLGDQRARVDHSASYHRCVVRAI